jgi:ABC-type transport system substrate-binding protein
VSPDDILDAKKSNPVLQLYKNDPDTGRFIFFGWNPALGAKTPFRDKRLRQAFSMSWDRDLWVDAFYNVDKFRQEGLPVETAWNAAVPLVDSGWWLDPKGKDFGPNAKYYQHNPAESKKLISAAGFPNGLDIEAHYITSTNYGLDFVKVVETLLGFANDVGMRMTSFPVDFNTEWRPKFADAQGDFPGVSFRNLASGNPDIPEKQIQVYTPLGGILYTGHFSETSSFRKGDPEVIDLLMKTRTEFDLEKRRAIIHDFQRMAAEKLYVLHSPGGGSSFTIAWPALRNQNVQRGEVVPYVGQWLDPTKAPITKT